ncbi:MAG: DUF3048 domain-containing protein [Candidatus Ancillula sp.]|jgi:hypothetical protein|nr:DUF3048 domain-containing protein [Candidatus Ancillula sp.]
MVKYKVEKVDKLHNFKKQVKRFIKFVLPKSLVDKLRPLHHRQRVRLFGLCSLILIVVIALIITLAVVLTRPKAEPVSEQPVQETKPVEKTKYYYPLTGVLAGEDKEAEAKTERPVVAVKIENSPDARPQKGLEDADIVWEELVEGGITRFAAIYNSNIPGDVGPVRSLRPHDIPFLKPWNPVIVYSGSKTAFRKRAIKAKIQLLSTSDDGFYRSDEKPAPHNLFFYVQKAFDQVDDYHNHPAKKWQDFTTNNKKTSAVKKGKKTTSITATYSAGFVTKWVYDQTLDNGKGGYKRYESGDPSMALSGQQHWAKNVIAFSAETETLKYKDPAGTPVPETLLNGKSGKGYYCSAGSCEEITWKKGVHEYSKIIYSDAKTKKPLVLAAGTTWINTVPVSSGSIVLG